MNAKSLTLLKATKAVKMRRKLFNQLQLFRSSLFFSPEIPIPSSEPVCRMLHTARRRPDKEAHFSSFTVTHTHTICTIVSPISTITKASSQQTRRATVTHYIRSQLASTVEATVEIVVVVVVVVVTVSIQRYLLCTKRPFSEERKKESSEQRHTHTCTCISFHKTVQCLNNCACSDFFMTLRH